MREKTVYPVCLRCGLANGDSRSDGTRTRPLCLRCTRENTAAGVRRCPLCAETKPLSEFGKNGKRASGLQTRCRPCMTLDVRRIRYGLDSEEFKALWKKQDGRCALCPRLFGRACVDHDHATGRVRGLLCVQCNSALGKLGDTAERLEKALAYVRGIV